MPRIRSIKPAFFVDEKIGELEPLDRLAFIGLWCHADKQGRLEDKPRQLAIQILPYDKGDFGDRIARLAAKGLVVRYGTNGHRYLGITNFMKHQKPHHTEDESVIPPPDESSVTNPLDNAIVTVTEPLSNGVVTDGRERKGYRKGKEYTKEFESFWALYPEKVNKGFAWTVWQRMSDEDRTAAMLALPAQAEVWRASSPDHRKFIPNASTWLNNSRWTDSVESLKIRFAPDHAATPFERKKSQWELEAELEETGGSEAYRQMRAKLKAEGKID